jgi:hypothetical protein
MTNFPMYIFGERADWSVLDLFCAGFLGENTTKYVHPRCIDYVGIDNDFGKLHKMKSIFQGTFIGGDIYNGINYDLYTASEIVISDQPTCHNKQIYSILYKVLGLATDYAVIGTNIQDMSLLPLENNGFYLQSFWYRSAHMGGTYWAVYKKI